MAKTLEQDNISPVAVSPLKLERIKLYPTDLRIVCTGAVWEASKSIQKEAQTQRLDNGGHPWKPTGTPHLVRTMSVDSLAS